MTQQNDGLIRSLAGQFWHRLYHIRMLEGRDVQPDNDPYGLFTRLANRRGIGVYTDHFRSGVIPTGYAWIADGTFNGAPGVNYSVSGSYMHAVSSATPHFLARTFTTWSDLDIVARLRTGQLTQIGLRADDTTNNNFVELMAIPSSGMYQLTFQYVIGGGGIVTVPATSFPLSEYCVIRLRHYAAGSQLYGYLVGEDGSNINVSTWYTPALAAWANFRAGIKVQVNGGNGGMVDWFYTTFT